MPRELGVVERLLEPIDADLAEERLPDLWRGEAGELEQRAREGVVLPPRVVQALEPDGERADPALHLPLQRLDPSLGLLETVERPAGVLDRAPGAVEAQLARVGRLEPVRQRPRRVHGALHVELLQRLLQALARGVGPAGQRLRRLYRGELRRVEDQLPDGVDRRQLEQRHVELRRPLAHGPQRLRGEAVALHRPGRCLPRGAEPQAAQPQVLHHELLLGQGEGVELDPDLLGLDQVLREVERIGDLERAQVHRGLVGHDVELADVHLRAQQLGAHLLRRVLGDRLREEPDQDREDQEEQQQRPDRLPAEDLHRHGLTPA